MSTVDLSNWIDSGSFKGSTEISVPEGWTVVDAKLRDVSPFHCTVTVFYDIPGKDKVESKELILRRPAPVVLAIRRTKFGPEVLVVKLVRHGAGDDVMELPGGMGEKDETYAMIAARELTEEGGLTVLPADLELLGTVLRDPARSPGLFAPVFFVEVSPSMPSTTPVVEAGEHLVGRQWINLEELYQLITGGEKYDGVLLSALTLATARGHLG